MDIQIPHSALKRYLSTDANPEKIAEMLSLCGPTVDSLEKIGDDSIYHLEIITNRVDVASAYGLAREAAVILPEFGYQAKLIPPDTQKIQNLFKQSAHPPLDLNIVNDPQLNHRIMAVKITGVTISPSPDWLVKALEKYGQRSLNNLVDITNYVMFELGHPVHVFDYDQLTTKKILVREAKKGERFITLDGNRHTTTGGEVIYEDGRGQIIDLPGIMGTQNSVVTDKTVNALIWIEDNDSLRIRKASLRHQLRTQAAILNEKAVDPELTPTALFFAAALSLELSQGQIGSRVLDLYPSPFKPKSIKLDPTWLSNFSGIKIAPLKLNQILTRLDFHPQTNPDSLITCTIPSYRDSDIHLQEDLAEEILRVYGYFRLPSNLPNCHLDFVPPTTPLTWEYRARAYLAGLGFTEVYNPSLISQELIKTYHLDEDQMFKLANPLSQDFEYMRSCLLPSLVTNLQHNLALSRPNLRLFELANVYHKKSGKQLADEQPHLAFICQNDNFSQAKGYLEALSFQLHLKFDYQPAAQSPMYFDPTKTARVFLQGHFLGYLGSLQQLSIMAAEINFGLLAQLANPVHTFKPVTAFSPIIEDLTFTLPEKTPVGPILAAIPALDPLIATTALKTVYHQNYTFTLTYQDLNRQLSVSDVAPIRKKLVTQLHQQFRAVLVGKLV